MNPWGMWLAFATPEEREEFAETLKQAEKAWSQLVLAPICLGLVLGAALII